MAVGCSDEVVVGSVKSLRPSDGESVSNTLEPSDDTIDKALKAALGEPLGLADRIIEGNAKTTKLGAGDDETLDEPL